MMNCQIVRNLLSAYIDSELSAEQRNLIRHHLFECENCEHEYQQLLKIKENLEKNLPDLSSSFDSWKSLQERIAFETATPIIKHSGDLFWSKKILATAACLLLFFIMATMLFPIHKRDSSSFAYIENSRQSSADQKISIEKSFEVYQASLIVP